MRFCLSASVLGLALAPLPAPGGDPRADPAALEKKVAELERQLAELRKEVQDLRRQVRPGAETAVAWGKVSDGLQAGLALRPGDARPYRVGDAVRFVIKVRNATDRPVEMRYQAVEPGARVGPSVLDAGGKRPAMSGPAYSSVGGWAANTLALAAGQEVEFASPELTFGPPGEPRVQAERTVLAGPGQFRVSYYVYYLNADDTANYLSTGEVEVEVLPPRKDNP